MATYDLDAPEPRGFVSLRALVAALGRVSIWLVVWCGLTAFAVVATIAWVHWLADATEHRYTAQSLLPYLEVTFRTDQADELRTLRASSAQVAAVLVALSVALYAFAAGGWLHVFLERTGGQSVRRFFVGGARYFWRFLRLVVLTVLLLALVTWLAHGWPWKTFCTLLGAPDGELEALDSEWHATFLRWLQAGTQLVLFALVVTWGDYTRTRLALQDTRSAFLAGLATLGLLLRRPLRTLRPMVVLVGAEAAVLALAASFAWPLTTDVGIDDGEGVALATLALLFVIGQLALLWRILVRGARYHAAIAVSRDLVPAPVPDRWARHVGGPGGPQYPIDTGDEYGVSL